MKTFCWCLTCLICVYSVYAQGDRGTLTGTIADSTGRVVPNAEVTVKNEGTGIAASTVTGESGSYTMPLLNIGKYTIIARVAGFKTYVRESVPVQVGQTTRVDILLELGRVAIEGPPERILSDRALQAAYLGRGRTPQRRDDAPTISVS